MNTHSVGLSADLAKLATLKVGDVGVAAQTWQTPAGGGHQGSVVGHDMAGMTGSAGIAGHLAPIPAAGVPDATAKIGGQPLAFKIGNGVRVFDLTARPGRGGRPAVTASAAHSRNYRGDSAARRPCHIPAGRCCG